jgi:hypothetical protein
MKTALRPVKPARCRRNDSRTEPQVSGLVRSNITFSRTGCGLRDRLITWAFWYGHVRASPDPSPCVAPVIQTIVSQVVPRCSFMLNKITYFTDIGMIGES